MYASIDAAIMRILDVFEIKKTTEGTHTFKI